MLHFFVIRIYSSFLNRLQMTTFSLLDSTNQPETPRGQQALLAVALSFGILAILIPSLLALVLRQLIVEVYV